MKILVTGAHFTPAVAVIEEIKKYPNIDIVYVGRNKTLEGDNSKSVESQILPNLGINFIPIITGRLQRNFTIYTLISAFKIPIGFFQAFYIILSKRPDVILSFGGYVAVPIVVSGWLFSIPIIIHEQTLITGLANKISSYFANKIAYSFKQDNDLSEKTILTGNPIRNQILSPNKKIDTDYQKLLFISRKDKLPLILITGGNQGSHTLNISVEKILPKLTKIACVIHLTGDSKYNDFERLERKQNDRYLVKKWIEKDWGALLSKVDLVISRAGINTLTELAFLGKPALVVPIPYLYKNEQEVNANFFKKIGLVEVLPQSKLSSESMLKNIRSMLSNLSFLNKKAKGATKFIIADAAKRIALETILLVKTEQSLR